MSSPATNCGVVDYAQMMDGLRSVYQSGRTKDIKWRRRQLQQIEGMFCQNHEAITAAVTADLGGPNLRGISEMSGCLEAQHALKNLKKWTKDQHVSGLVNKQCVRHEPKGVVLIISPWNFPFTLCLGPLVSAIAAGNCVVIKPSEMAPKSAELIKSLVEQYLDRDCVKVVLGAVPETTSLLSQQWDHIFYTGNGTVGKLVLQAAAQHLTPVTLELGGKSPVIIDETAQMDAAVNRVSSVKWMNCGQICVSPDYVLVHRSRAEEFTMKMKESVTKAFGEDPKANADWGRIVNERHTERIKRLIETSGGEILHGGTDGVDIGKRYVPPTIIMDPSLDSAIMQEEIFGPVLPVLVFDHLDEALAIVTSRETPLALYIYTQSSQNAEKVLSTATSGGACVNSCMEHIVDMRLPFGGKGASGMGVSHGKHGFDEFSHSRAVLYKTTMPGGRGAFVPLPDAENPAPSWVYNLAVRLVVKGVFRRRLARCFRGKAEPQPLE